MSDDQELFPFVLVKVSLLSADMRAIIDIHRSVGTPIDMNGKIYIDLKYKDNPKRATRVIDGAFYKYDVFTPLPLAPSKATKA
jgi:hypothetical protein